MTPNRSLRVIVLLASAMWLSVSTSLSAQQDAKLAQSAAPDVTLFKTTVRRVVLDVVVTDSTGKAVSGLTKDAFTIAEDNKPQPVLSFDVNGFDPGMDYLPPKLPQEPPNTFVNLPATPEKGPLYVLLFDLVNMDNPDQMETREDHGGQIYARAQLVKFIQEKPEGARFAIFVWSDGLHLVQGFTSDKAQLLASVDPSNPKLHMPRVFLMAANFGQGNTHATLSVLNFIANYLDGLPGRKNLIWFSGGFPLSLFASDDDGPIYAGQVKATLDLMAANQIAIYPVDGRGVVSKNWKSPSVPSDGGAGAPTVSTPGAAAPASGSQAAAANSAAGGEQGYSLLSHSYQAEDEIAKATGGRAFYSNNDLKTALVDATQAGQSYYTLTYSPANQVYNGKLREIQVDLAPRYRKAGYSLAYRHDYYGLDPDAPMPVAKRVAAAAQPEAPRKVGDTLYANMEHGAPMAHQLVFGAHVHAVGAPAKGTAEQMAQLATQPAYFKARRKTAQAKPLAPIELQRFAIDYTVMAHQLQLSGAETPPNLEIAAAAYDTDGKMLNAIVNDAISGAPETAAQQQKRKAYLAEQEIDLPLEAKTIRIAVRDANTDRIGAMEISLPLAPENESAAGAPKQAAPAKTN